MVQKDVDMVKSDFSMVHQDQINNLMVSWKALTKARLRVPLGPSLSRGPGGIPSEWTDACCFVKPPKSQTECLIRKHGAFEIDREELGLSSKHQPLRDVDLSLSHEYANRRTRPRAT